MDDSFVKTPEEVLSFFNVKPTQGLLGSQVSEQLKKYGKNGKNQLTSYH
jgi:Ca2+ transporting ATPase